MSGVAAEVGSGSPAAGSVILRAEKVSKAFPGTLALDNVDYDARGGAVNVLVGENGAGKSTLMKILAGVEEPTGGSLFLEDRQVTFRTVHDAAAHGIGIVFQELNLCPNLSIADNIFLTHPFTRAKVHLDRRRQREGARELMHRLEHDIDPETLVGELRIGEQQIVEIAKALSRDVKVLIMDEPTSALSATEVDVLFRVIADLKRQGVAIIYISHRLEEVVRIGDHIAVLRDGRMQAQSEMRAVDIPWIIERMVGRRPPAERRSSRAGPREEILRVEGATLEGEGGKLLLDRVDLQVAAGEVVAMYGLMGAGRSELFEFIFGLRPEGRGRVWVTGREVSTLSLAERIRAGVSLVPEDRQRDGLIQNMSVARNLTISSLYQLRRRLHVDDEREARMVGEMIGRLQIKVASPDVSITALSGGNQQKVVIGKDLLTSPKLLLLDDPTRGIDVGAKVEVFKTMRQLADAGLGVLFATSDLKEALGADRIVILSQGKVAGEMLRDDATEEQLVAASTRFIATSPAAARRASEIS
jgi:erythritol transport system ATP-binding protein